METVISEHSKIQGDFAAFTVNDVSKSLTPHRPPTQPSSDIEQAKRGVLTVAAKNLTVIQIALFSLLIVLLEYLILPARYVHGIAFLTLCVSTSVGIYLTTI